jgi:Predicted deacylase
MVGKLCVGELMAAVGSKVQGYVKVGDSQTHMPVTLINGRQDGKTILITGGIHGGEYPCIQTTIELAQELEARDIAGRIIIVHPVNTQGFAAKVSAVVPEDGKNISRNFPGKRNGSIAEQIAYTLTNDFFAKADFYMDLHGGDLHEEVTPFVYYAGLAEPRIVEQSKQAAAVLHLQYMVKSTATAGSYNVAAAQGVPCFMIERGGRALWFPEEVAAYKQDVKNVLRYLGVLAGKVVYPVKPPADITTTVYLDATSAGCWYPLVNVNEQIKKGQALGIIKDFFGKTLATYYATMDGFVLYMTVSLAVENNEPLVAYGQLP